MECLDPYTGEILSNKMYSHNSAWFYDIEERTCRSISSECLSINNQNRFKSLDECKTQCIPNVGDKQTEGNIEL